MPRHLLLGKHYISKQCHKNNDKMVFLTMTTSMVEALKKLQHLTRKHDHTILEPASREEGRGGAGEVNSSVVETRVDARNVTALEKEEPKAGIPIGSTQELHLNEARISDEPSLKNPRIGNPISHGQVIGLSKLLKAHGIFPNSLDLLLRGARVYVPPPPPKPEPVSFGVIYKHWLIPFQDIRI
jgi:TMEM199 family protein